ncbi:hypothetical protein SLH49_21050 [Cognatiyoonia sp. IB215446]|uniref:hypothetical protein n=1 Tax=Cognatiyoonia sp. IB215446 TaxID=3097355 RepID=UPI002A1510C6|nr:hypothetical protein [Cognatiyoonia sp. IB215446]MDX8350485.1 hypothetical protein [Cognatiyoonia sp. IB215446]
MSLLDAQLPAVREDAPSQFVVLTVVAIVLTGLSVLWSFVDPRTIEGVAVWMKPLKFSLSFAVLFATIAFVETRLSEQARQGWALQIVVWVMAAAFLAEMTYIMYQAGRAEASHFNFDMPFNEFMYTVVMFGGAVALVAGTATIGWIVKSDKDADLSPAMREAIWLGFLLTFVLTMVVANYLGATGRFVGVHPEGAPTLPLVGWSGVTGDLRPAHFASLHAMQALPLLALWLTRGGQTGSVRTIRFAAIGYSALTAAVFVQALMGFPLIPLA